MNLDELDLLWERHPAWRLLRARNAPLVLSFLGAQFVDGNRGAVPASQLVAALDDVLYEIHRTDPDRYPADPAKYLDDWAQPDVAVLRRFYPEDLDEIHYEATPALERAYQWVEGLRARAFVGTESRLQIAVDLLRQIVHGAEVDPESRIAELERRQAAIEQELADVRAGHFEVLDDTALRDRYQQFSATARDLLSDFREVEENFRSLDRSARERIARWDGGKGELLEELVTSRADITTSDQGRSFRSFYELLLSEQRQEELSALLMAVQAMPKIGADRRMRTVHHDWADAAERTQQTVRNLSEQLRRFLDDQVWIENRRVLDLIRSAEASALAVRDVPPRASEVGMVVDIRGVHIELPFERPLYQPDSPVELDSLPAPQELNSESLDTLFEQRFVDTARLMSNIRSVVPPRAAAALDQIIGLFPLEEGVAEILGYLSLGGDELEVTMGEDGQEMTIDYVDQDGCDKRVRMPQTTITRLAASA